MYLLVLVVEPFHYYKNRYSRKQNLGGFPITGQFLICTNPDTIAKHDAKVYGKEPKGTPPMTVPHLDTLY